MNNYLVGHSSVSSANGLKKIGPVCPVSVQENRYAGLIPRASKDNKKLITLTRYRSNKVRISSQMTGNHLANLKQLNMRK